MLKIAGVKSEKEFYKKYPTEEAFMAKHGKAFKKAAMGKSMVNEQLHQLTEWDNPREAGLGDLIGKVTKGLGGEGGFGELLGKVAGGGATGGGGFDLMKGIDSLKGNATNTAAGANAAGAAAGVAGAVTGGAKGGGLGDMVGGILGKGGGKGADFVKSGAGKVGLGLLNSATDIVKGFGQIKEQNKAIDKANQASQLSGLTSQVAGLKPEQQQRKYTRPEDNLVQPGQLGSPTGTGTSYLQDGGEIQNTYAPNDIYTDLGFEPLGETLKQYRHGGHVQSAAFGDYFQDSGQASIGKGVGSAIGSIFGPAGSAVGGLLGTVAGNVFGGVEDAEKLKKFQEQTKTNELQATFANQAAGLNAQTQSFRKNGGNTSPYEWVSHTWQPQVIASFGEYKVKDLLKPPHDADMLRAGGHLKEYTAPSAEAMFTGRPELEPLTMDNGGRMTSTNMMFDTDRYPSANDGIQMAMGGDLKVGDGGYLETLSHNPNLPGGEIGMFRGQSHDNGGIQTQYGDNNVEVEGGEPAVKLQDGGSSDNLVVFGNMKINKNIADLMGDPKAKDMKFKTYIADIAKNDKKQNKRIQKALELIENSDENSAFDHLSLNTGQAMLEGAKAWQKINADKIKEAAVVQDAIHQTARELGVKSDKLAEGKMEKETDLSMIAQDGKTLQSFLKTPLAQRKQIAKDLGYTDYSGKTAAQQQKLYDLFKKNKGTGPYNAPKAVNLTDSRQPNYAWTTQEAQVPVKPVGVKGGYDQYGSYYDDNGEFVDQSGTLPGMFSADQIARGKSRGRGIDWKTAAMSAFSNVEPFLRPTNANQPLPPDQLYPEYFALATNQLEPVQAQTFQPMLDTPYDISFQDQLNAVDSQSRAAIRAAGNNPGAQASIMAQALEAKNRVLGEQFRVNQANKANTYAKNRDLLNQAQMQNLQILDNQYVRQAQAKSNTKQQAQAALSSIAAKTAQQRASNKKLAIMENMYGFRFSPSGVAYNINAPRQFDMSGSGKSSSYGALNNLLGKNKRVTTDPTTGEVVGIRTLTKDEMSGSGPSMAEIDSAFDKNGGKTSKTKSRNSSIVKALKNL